MEKQIKYLSTLSFILALLLTGCGEKSPIPETQKNKRYSLILVDKTLSSSASEDLIKQHEKEITNQVVRERFEKYGDHVIGHFVHANTLSNPPFTDKFFDQEAPDGENMGGMDKMKAKNNYQSYLRTERRQLLKEVQTNIKADNKDLTNQYTDLWAIFELMSNQFEDSTPKDDKLVIIMSDMKESMNGNGRRDFHKNPIADKATAENMAQEDAKWIQANLDVEIDRLAATNIRVLPPISSTAKSGFQNLRYYWNKLFKEMGINEISYY